MAQIGQVVGVGFAKFEPARHGRKHGTEALAVAAGVADLQLARHFKLRRTQGDIATGQGTGITRQGLQLHQAPYLFKLAHQWLLI